MLDVERGMGHAPREYFSHRSQMSTDAMWANISKNTRPGEAYRTIQTLAVILKNTNLSNLSNDD